MSLSFSPYDYEFHNDPYPLYARLRAEAPVYRNDELDFWALSRYDDVAAGFRDFATYSNAHGVMIEPGMWTPDASRFLSFLAMDPPRHTAMRGLISRGFTPRRVAGLEPRIREMAGRYLDAALDRGSFDFMIRLEAAVKVARTRCGRELRRGLRQVGPTRSIQLPAAGQPVPGQDGVVRPGRQEVQRHRPGSEVLLADKAVHLVVEHVLRDQDPLLRKADRELLARLGV